MKDIGFTSIQFLLILLFCSTQIVAQDNNAAIIHLKVLRMNDTFIDVYHNKPEGKDKLPLLIFCQGSGYDSNTEGILGLFRQFKNKAVGIAIEKQGVQLGDKGDTLKEEYKLNNMVYNRLYDYLRVLQYLRANATWWNGDVYVIGGSEGGLLAGMLACYYPTVKAVAIFSFGGGLNFGEAWPVSSGLQKKAALATSTIIENEIQSVQDSLKKIHNNPGFIKSYSGEDNTYAWWNSIMDLRLQNALLDLTIPIYVVQGTEDMMAPPVSAQKLHAAFIKEGKTNLFYKEYKGYDHEYKDSSNTSHLVQVVMDATKWILDKNNNRQ